MGTLTQVLLNWMVVASININATFLTTDYLENAYLITQDNSLVKTDSVGNILFTYNQNRFGKLAFADVTNPFKIILSYPDYGTVVMVDNTLSEIGTVSLKPLGIYDYSALCFSPQDNNFWVYDLNDFKLKKVDRNGNIVLTSADLFQQLGYVPRPVYMQEENQYLFLSDTSRGIIVFDLYGIYYETLPFYEVPEFQVRDDQIFFPESDYLRSYQMKSLSERKISLPEHPGGHIRLENNRLYLLKIDSLTIFKF